MTDKLLYFNIITHKVRTWNELSDIEKTTFINHIYDNQNQDPAVYYEGMAPLRAEYAKVINVSFGYLKSSGEWKAYSINGLDESEILKKVSSILDAFAASGYAFAGYNVTYFDIPFLTKRFIINGIRIPDSLKRYDKKYWELNDFNLKQFWKFNGGYDTPLEVICASLGIDMKDASEIGEVFESSIGEVDFGRVAELSSLRNELVHAVYNKLINLID